MELVISERDATVTGVTFEWLLRCPYCREITHVSRQDGKVQAGLNVSASRKTCRWYQRDLPGRMPELPSECPHCHEARPYRGYPSREATPVAKCACGYLQLLNDAYATLRAAYPLESGRADEVMQAQARRNSIYA
jgi:hypothetical protein